MTTVTTRYGAFAENKQKNAAELPPILGADSLPLERGNTSVVTHVVVTAQWQPRGTQHDVYVSHRSPSCFLPIFAKHNNTLDSRTCIPHRHIATLVKKKTQETKARQLPVTGDNKCGKCN